MSYISKEDLRERLEHEFNACDHMPKVVDNIGSYQMGVMGAITILDSIPERMGEWLSSCNVVSEGELWKSWVCSECNHRVLERSNCCPNCGIKNRR